MKSQLLLLNRNVSTLYVVFLLFLSSALLAGNITALYLSEFLAIAVLFVRIYSPHGMLNFLRNYFNLAAVILVISIIYVSGAEIYTLLVILKVIFLYKYFIQYLITEEEIVKFVNATYIFYLIPCVINYFYIITFSSIDGVNAFREDLFGFSFVTLFSFEGSTAYIDSYSGLIFLVNYFLNKEKNKWKWSALGLFALLWTTRMTPVVATFGSFVYYFIYPLGLTYVLSIFLLLQFSLIIWLQNQPDFIKFFFASLTHNRSLMWTQHFEIFLDNLSIKEFFFSTFDDRYIITVYGHQRETFNPHNSYLLLLYNSVIGFLVLAYFFLKNANSVVDRKWKTIIFSILVAAITNSHILGLGNPVYLILITYFFYASFHHVWRNENYLLIK